VKILIIRFSSIGDIVLTTPVVRCLRQQLAVDTHIHYLVKQEFIAVIDTNPHINKCWAYEKTSEKALISSLAAQNFDVVIDLQNNWRSMRIRRAMGAKKSYVFNKLNVRKWLLTQFKINILPPLHVVDRYMQTVADLGVGYDGRGLDYFIPPSEEIDPFGYADDDFWQRYPKYVAVAIGAAHGTKQIPTQKVAEVAKILATKGIAVLLLGGKNDIKAAEQVTNEQLGNVLNLVGQLSLHSSASILRQSWRVLAPDTGLMHIAAALGCRMVSVWGNTVPAFGMTAFYPVDSVAAEIIQNNNISCRPCSKLGYPTCPKSHFDCMQQIKSSDIVAALLGLGLGE
jgi:ADP-heptose:LPS heptosyltransferase